MGILIAWRCSVLFPSEEEPRWQILVTASFPARGMRRRRTRFIDKTCLLEVQ